MQVGGAQHVECMDLVGGLTEIFLGQALHGLLLSQGFLEGALLLALL